MDNSKLISALSTLKKTEWSSFKRFVLMQTRESSDIFQLFEILKTKKNNLKDIKDGTGIKEKAFSGLSHKGFLNLQSKLYGWLEEWMIIEELKIQKFQSDLLLIKSLNRRSLFKHADYSADKLEKKIKSQKLNIENQKALADLSHAMYYSNNPIKYTKGPVFLEELVTTHLQNFNNQNALYKAELNSWGRIKQYDYTKLIHTLDIINNELPPGEITSTTDHLIHMLAYESIAAFNDLLNTLVVKKEIEPHTEFHTIITLYLILYAQNFWQSNQLENPKALLNLFDYAFSQGIFEEHGKINSIKFHNIINIMASSNTYEDVEVFIQNWISKVKVYNVQDTIKLAQAQNAFYHEEYDKIIPLTREISNLEFSQKSRAMSLHLIGQYYDRNDTYDIFMNSIRNYKRFLNRNKKKYSKKVYNAYLILAKAIELLGKDEFTSEELNINYQGVIYKKWIEKELKKREV